MAKKLLMVLNKRKERGASMLEYALLAALIAVVCIGGVTLIGNSANNQFTAVGNAIAA